MNVFPDAFMRTIAEQSTAAGYFVYKLHCGHIVTVDLEYGVGATMYCSACEAASPNPLKREHRISVATGLLNTAALMAGQGNTDGAIDKARGAIAQLKLLATGDSGQRAAGNPQRPTNWISPPRRRRSDREEQ